MVGACGGVVVVFVVSCGGACLDCSGSAAVGGLSRWVRAAAERAQCAANFVLSSRVPVRHFSIRYSWMS